nr:translation initiation factor IF-2-like [Aegilops tauschii subsp. strangulata]
MTESEGLKGSDLLTAFVVRRVLPLQGQPHLISRMSGHRDSCQMSTKEMPSTEVARLVNYISNFRHDVDLHNPVAADALEQGQEYLPDRSMSGSGGGGSRGGGLEDWSNDEEEENESRRPSVAGKAGASSSAAPTAPGGAPKRQAGAPLFDNQPKKPKSTAAMTRREEAAAKAARLKKAPKQPPMVSAAPLSLERAASGSVIGAAEGSTNTHRVDPLADLQEAMERNAQEAREEREEAERQREAAKSAQEEADAAAKAQADAATKAQANAATKSWADAAAKAKAEEAARGQTPQLIVPLRSAPPAPGIPAPTGGAGNEQPVMEREGGDAVIFRTEVLQQAPTAEAQGSRPDVPPTPQVGSELVVRATPVARTPVRSRAAKAISAPRLREIRA